MNESGVRNQQAGVERIGFSGLEAVHWNWPVAALQEEAVRRGEGEIAADGPLAVRTGSHTGRSPKDKFVVRSPLTEDAVWWENNKEMSRAQFDRLFDDMRAHARGRTLFAQDLYGGADERYRISARVYCEYAWHALFIRNLLIRPKREDLAGFTPELTIIDLPSFRADPERHGVRTQTVIACDFDNKVILIGGTSYAGEMKKSVFTVLNFFLPPQGVMPMHCSANMGPQGDVALFFGLSGTGKTTLSADPNRTLIGDDEHGWGEDGIFNFEGGCYAKMINLSAEAEPEIFSTTRRFGTVLENVVLDPETRQPQFDDASLTENTRGAYPIHFIPNASPTGRGGHPKNILMLTADAFGVLPPIARLTPSEAMVQFLSGYTAKVAGTEKGVEEPEATFSTCFGAPFMPRHPSEYGLLLRDLIARHGADCWLVNTGWTGGAYGTGRRMPIAATRALLAAVLDGRLRQGRFRRDPVFGFDVPVSDDPAFAHLLDPRATWADKAAYDAQARKLVTMFNENFARFEAYVDADVRAATPGRAAA
jgi:phosphoenolpyruvate carboxykinase (ATP)